MTPKPDLRMTADFRLLLLAIERDLLDAATATSALDQLTRSARRDDPFSLDSWLQEHGGISPHEIRDLRAPVADTAPDDPVMAETLVQETVPESFSDDPAQAVTLVQETVPESLSDDPVLQASPTRKAKLDRQIRDMWTEESPGDPQDSGFGRFTDIEFLTEGGMGQILTATDPSIDRRVAIKILQPSITSHKVHLQKFQNEFRLTGQLEHPGIVPVHESGTADDGRVYFCMKLVQGESLAELLETYRTLAVQQNKPFDPTPFLRHLLRICDALSFAHSRNIVHRDLKPANLMVGAFGEVLVMDWGLARKVRGPGADPLEESTPSPSRKTHDPLQTVEGSVLGTPAYMAPEQAWGMMNEIDEQTDVYALGAILYEILAGSPPQKESNTQKIIERIQRGELERPSDRAPEHSIPAELEAVVMKAMAHEKSDRYRNAKEFQDDIQAYLDGRALGAAQYNPLQLLLKWVGRNRKACASAGLVVLIWIGFFVVQTWRERQEHEAKFLSARDKADEFLNELGDFSSLLGTTELIDTKTGRERRESPQTVALRETVIEAHLNAAQQLRRALRHRPDDLPTQELLLETWKDIADLALGGQNYLLANFAHRRLENRGVEVKSGFDNVKEARSKLLMWREIRLKNILDDLKRGLDREGRHSNKLLTDFVFEAVGYRDLQTVKILGEDLESLVEKAKTEREKANWTQPERDRAKFVCRVLGRLGFSECVEPLGKWMAVIADDELAVEAGLALCNTHSPRAHPHLLKARHRLGLNTTTWWKISQFLNRLPKPKPAKTVSMANDFLLQGLSHKERGEFQEAINSYTQALKINPGYFEAYINRGSVRKLTGDPEGAIEDYNKAIKLNEKLAFPYCNRGNAKASMGNLTEAMEDYNKALKINPKEANFYLSRGKLYCNELKNYDAAIADFTLATKLNPQYANAYFWRGYAHQSKEKLTEAIQDYSKALECDPLYASAYNSRGQVHMQRRDLDSAMEDFNKAIEIDPKLSRAYNNRGFIFQLKDRLDTAIVDFDKAIEIAPTNAKAHYDRGNIRRRLGNLDQALEDYNRSIEIDPKAEIAYLKRGDVRQEMGDLNGAIEDYNQVIVIEPKNVGAYINRGVARNANGDSKGAIEDYNQAIEIEPKNARAYYNRAVAQTARNDPQKAIADYTKAIEFKPLFPEAYTNRGNHHLALGNFLEAISDIEKALSIAEPSWRYRKQSEALLAKAHHNHGKALLEKGDLGGAIADFGQAIQFEPKRAESYYLRGHARQKNGNLDGAIKDYSQAIRIDPQSSIFYISRGTTWAGKGNQQKAIEDYNQAIELVPNNANAYYNRGLAQTARNNLEKAIADYTKAIELDPEHTKAYAYRGSIHLSQAETHTKNGSVRLSQNKLQFAIADFEKAIVLASPRWEYRKQAETELSTAYYNHSLLLAKSGNFDAALQSVSRAIELLPSDYDFHIQRGTILFKKKKPETARADYSNAIEIDPKRPEAYFNRAITFRQSGDLDSAIADYNATLLREPRYWKAWIHLGQCFFQKGQPNRSLDALRKALPLAPENEKPRILRMIQQVQGK
ncbi:MAG: tetratricopeptide repeat protein [Planctomycetota bacterium]|nr:tetratricopeptide repeat protein [Planctomycetota bacterium]